MARAFVVDYMNGKKTPIGVGERTQLINHICDNVGKDICIPMDRLFLIVDESGEEEDVTTEVKSRVKNRIDEILKLIG